MSELIETIARAIQDKKAKNIVSLDLSAFDGAVCPAFVICNADSTTQVEAAEQWRLGRDGLRKCAGAYLSDRIARFLQTR